ncbi:A-kinase anchor protein 200-like isoform X2 [Toxorhynchites rutilus septentrionalis]|uniref:A-kinase anchor protein 200-like isoform X2 n=1 Tax=Toxorhynchites rutilus septentrionalis TaxID=329112 RepID=UPI00247958C3|nr:A-kinase anchor protein 200-like isoform X2 [Toxorhynchites rutilus septentrionalis]
MGKAQSKRSVDITTDPAKDGVVTEGAGKLEKIEDVDQLKPQVNGDAQHTEGEAEKKSGSETTENEKDTNTEKEIKEGAGDAVATVAASSPTTDKAAESSDSEPANKTLENGSNDETLNDSKAAAEDSNKKPKKIKKKWSFRSISFSRKDKPKPTKKEKEGEEKVNGDCEKVPEEPTEDAAAAAVAASPESTTETKTEAEVASVKEETVEEPTIEAAVASPAQETAPPAKAEATTPAAETTPAEPAPAATNGKPEEKEEEKPAAAATAASEPEPAPEAPEKEAEPSPPPAAVVESVVVVEVNKANEDQSAAVPSAAEETPAVETEAKSDTIVVEQEKPVTLESDKPAVEAEPATEAAQEVAEIVGVPASAGPVVVENGDSTPPPPLPSIPPPSQVMVFAEASMSQGLAEPEPDSLNSIPQPSSLPEGEIKQEQVVVVEEQKTEEQVVSPVEPVVVQDQPAESQIAASESPAPVEEPVIEKAEQKPVESIPAPVSEGETKSDENIEQPAQFKEPIEKVPSPVEAVVVAAAVTAEEAKPSDVEEKKPVEAIVAQEVEQKAIEQEPIETAPTSSNAEPETKSDIVEEKPTVAEETKPVEAASVPVVAEEEKPSEAAVVTVLENEKPTAADEAAATVVEEAIEKKTVECIEAIPNAPVEVATELKEAISEVVDQILDKAVDKVENETVAIAEEPKKVEPAPEVVQAQPVEPIPAEKEELVTETTVPEPSVTPVVTEELKVEAQAQENVTEPEPISEADEISNTIDDLPPPPPPPATDDEPVPDSLPSPLPTIAAAAPEDAADEQNLSVDISSPLPQNSLDSLPSPPTLSQSDAMSLPPPPESPTTTLTSIETTEQCLPAAPVSETSALPTPPESAAPVAVTEQEKLLLDDAPASVAVAEDKSVEVANEETVAKVTEVIVPEQTVEVEEITLSAVSVQDVLSAVAGLSKKEEQIVEQKEREEVSAPAQPADATEIVVKKNGTVENGSTENGTTENGAVENGQNGVHETSATESLNGDAEHKKKEEKIPEKAAQLQQQPPPAAAEVTAE